MKYLLMVLSAFLVVAAAGRFHAEAQVRQSERELAKLDRERDVLSSDIERARLEVEVLESAGRLSRLNASHLALGSVRAEQLLDDRDFAHVIGARTDGLASDIAPEADIIGSAIAMSDPTIADATATAE